MSYKRIENKGRAVMKINYQAAARAANFRVDSSWIVERSRRVKHRQVSQMLETRALDTRLDSYHAADGKLQTAARTRGGEVDAALFH
jgi:glutamine synthetase